MASKRLFNFVFKVRCDGCMNKFVPDCKSCSFIKWRRMNKLVKSVGAIEDLYPNWIFINVYARSKEEKNGRFLERYTNGKTRKIPSSNNELDHML